jgi:hypothetical protein
VLALSEPSSLYAHPQPRRSRNSFTCFLKLNQTFYFIILLAK